MMQYPSIEQARFPQTYEHARTALTECSRIDECKDWADKAEALASYGKQANDESLVKLAMRIKARALRRAGELLKQLDGRGNNQHSGDAPTKLTQRQAAEQAGMSKDQQVQAIRVANVPEPEFTAQVESETPPTITTLAEQGKKPGPRPVIDLKGRDPNEFNLALHYIAGWERAAKDLKNLKHDRAIPILTDAEIKRLRAAISAVDSITDNIITRV